MQLRDAFRSLISPNETVLDVGSFDGGSAALFSELVGKEGRVYAFEPHPYHYLKLSILAANQGSRNIHPYCRAVSNYRGHVSFFVSNSFDSAHREASTIVESNAKSSRLGDNFGKLLVETCRLDDFCTDLALRPNFIKVDVEGAEDTVFLGAIGTLESNRPLVIFENGWGQGTPVPSHIGLFEAMGYDLFCVDVMNINGRWVSDNSPQIFRISTADFSKAPSFLCNILAVPKSRTNNFPLRDRISLKPLLELLSQI